MKECGKTIYNMAEERKHGLMALFMRVTTWEERNMDLENTAGTMALHMREIGMRTRLRVSAPINGSTEGASKGLG